VSIYLDASVLVAFFTLDSLSTRADRLMRSIESVVVVSNFAAAEFTSALGRRVRNKEIPNLLAQEILETFDEWLERGPERTELLATDIATAEIFLRRFGLSLRAPDAMHLAMTQRLGTTLATFDAGMTAAARTLRIPVMRTPHA